MSRSISALLLLLAVSLVGFVLSGCATMGIVPDQLLHCEPQPVAPTAAGTTERQVGYFIVDLAAAGDDCRTKLGSVREILRPEK